MFVDVVVEVGVVVFVVGGICGKCFYNEGVLVVVCGY